MKNLQPWAEWEIGWMLKFYQQKYSDNFCEVTSSESNSVGIITNLGSVDFVKIYICQLFYVLYTRVITAAPMGRHWLVSLALLFLLVVLF